MQDFFSPQVSIEVSYTLDFSQRSLLKILQKIEHYSAEMNISTNQEHY